MKLNKWAALTIAIGLIVASQLFFGDLFGLSHAHAAFADPMTVFTANAALLALRTEHTDLLAKAAAKIAEIKVAMAADAIAKIETDHAELLRKAGEVKAKIATEESRERTEQQETAKLKPWASAFYMSAEASNIALKDLNEIVANSASHEVAKDTLIDAMAKAQNADKPSPTGQRATVGTEATEKFVIGATAALTGKVPMLNSKAKPAERNEFSGLSLREIARMSLDLRGIRNVPHDPMTMVANAFAPVIMAGSLSTSDFTNILANVANKAMLKGYEEAGENFDKWTGKGTLTDFKTASRVDLGLFPSLAKVVEGAEYTYAKMNDRGVSLVLATYGKIFPITRQAIINDDLGAFTKVPAKMGQASKRTIADLVYAILTSNPNAPDGTALFHASHSNLGTGGGSALSATSLNAGRTAMGRQADPDNIKQGLNIRPAYWIGPITLQGSANQIFASQAEPGQDNPAVANRVAGMAEVVTDGRLDVASTTAWYLSADPSRNDTIEVDYLNGVESPVLEQKEGWNVDGVEMKVRMDAGVTLLDFRGLYKANGA